MEKLRTIYIANTIESNILGYQILYSIHVMVLSVQSLYKSIAGEVDTHTHTLSLSLSYTPPYSCIFGIPR